MSNILTLAELPSRWSRDEETGMYTAPGEDSPSRNDWGDDDGATGTTAGCTHCGGNSFSMAQPTRVWDYYTGVIDEDGTLYVSYSSHGESEDDGSPETPVCSNCDEPYRGNWEFC